MNNRLTVRFTVTEFCKSVQISEDILNEIIDEGILDPSGTTPETWYFDAHMAEVARRAIRLQKELDIEWAGIAVAMDLLKELDQLRTENDRLRQRLGRFIQA